MRYIYQINTTDKPKDIYVFESPIDAMSYKSLNKDKDGVFVSINGLKQEAVKYQIAYYIMKYDKKLDNIHLCVDNHSAGNEFVKHLKNQHLTLNSTGKELDFKADQTNIEDGKDWNDVLIKQKLKTLDKNNTNEKKKKKQVSKK